MGRFLYEYKVVNISLEPPLDPSIVNPMRKPSIETAANRWAALGWRTVAVMPSPGAAYADCILIERKVLEPPTETKPLTERRSFRSWRK